MLGAFTSEVAGMARIGLTTWVVGALVVATLVGGWMHRQRQFAWVESGAPGVGGLALGGDPACLRAGDALTITFLDAHAEVDVVVPATARQGDHVPATIRVMEDARVSSGRGSFVVDESGDWLGGRFEGTLDGGLVRGRLRVRVPEVVELAALAVRGG